MYARPYKLKDVEELQSMTTLADWLLALPALSVTLDGALSRSTKSFRSHVHQDAVEFLPLAHQLRQPTLFKECMIHIVSE